MNTRKTVGNSNERSNGVDLLLAQPSRDDWKQMAKYPDAQLRELLNLDKIASVKAAIIATPVMEIMAASRLLKLCGFQRLSHALLTESPPYSETIRFNAIVTAEREIGEMINVPRDWTPDDECDDSFDVNACAAEFAPRAKSIVRLFAFSWPTSAAA